MKLKSCRFLSTGLAHHLVHYWYPTTGTGTLLLIPHYWYITTGRFLTTTGKSSSKNVQASLCIISMEPVFLTRDNIQLHAADQSPTDHSKQIINFLLNACFFSDMLK